MDKNIIKGTMLSLEGAACQSARKNTSTTLLMLGSTEANRSNTMSRPRPKSGDLSEALDDTLHDHTVRLSGRYFVIAVSTSKFVCDGRDVIGISTKAPIFGGDQRSGAPRCRKSRVQPRHGKEIRWHDVSNVIVRAEQAPCN